MHLQDGARALGGHRAGADLDFARIRLTCPGLASAPYLELYSVREGKAGSRLISACRVVGGSYRSILVDRGFVRPGFAADMVLFDPATVADTATFDQPRRAAAGFSHVFVRGQLALDDGELTGVTAGRSLRRGDDGGVR